MSLLRSVGARLSLALALVVALALAVAYAIVVPRLERNLVQAKLDQLTRSAEAAGADFPTQTAFSPTPANYDFEIETYRLRAAEATNASVLVFENPFAASRLRAVEEGRAGGRGGSARDRLIAGAALSGSVERGVVIRDGKRFAEVAYPVLSAYGETNVILFVASLEDTLANVKLVERRLLVAGGLALLVSLPLGFGAATLFARRIRRLERAAYRIAGGQLDEPVADRGNDELGQLARAFERMRRQLSHLEHARREFIANASHELRTPLFSLSGFLELSTGDPVGGALESPDPPREQRRGAESERERHKQREPAGHE